MVKIVAAEFGPCFAKFNRLSYRRGCYPFQWTMGKVKVLWKSASKEDCSNYWPITLLSIPSKITKSVICDNIERHLRQVLERNQWGCRKGVSTEALLYLKWNLENSFGPRESYWYYLSDFRKAFVVSMVVWMASKLSRKTIVKEVNVYEAW